MKISSLEKGKVLHLPLDKISYNPDNQKNNRRDADKSQTLFDSFRSKQKGNGDDWNPLSLPTIVESDQIVRSKLIFRSVWLLFLIVLFNFFPQWVGLFMQIDNSVILIPIIIFFFTSYMVWIGFYKGMKLVLYLWLLFVLGLIVTSPLWEIFNDLTNGNIEFIPLLATSFSAYIIWVSLYWGSKILHNIWIVIIGEKTTSIRWVHITLKIFSLLIF